MRHLWLEAGEARHPIRIGETLLGRSPYCTVVVADPSVSRQHAALRREGAELSVEDLGSRNGTRRNGELIRTVKVVVPGDILQLGSAILRIVEVRPDGTGRAETPPWFPAQSIDEETLELSAVNTIEAFIAQAIRTGRARELESTFRALFDDTLAGLARRGGVLSPERARRLCAAARALAAAVPSTWCDELVRKLEAGS